MEGRTVPGIDAGSPVSEERARLMAAVQNSGYNTATVPPPTPSLQNQEGEAGMAELTLLHVLEMLLEYTTNYLTLAPLFGISQPLYVLKTRAYYRALRQTHVPPPRIQEVDEAGEPVAAAPPTLLPIRWRRIRDEEGYSALWKGWNSRLMHQALWRGGSLTLLQYALIFPGNTRLGIVFKSLGSFAFVTYVSHPLEVAQVRMQAACSGYSHASLYSATINTLKDTAAYDGVWESLALAALSVPVKFGFFALPLSIAWMCALYPLDKRATKKKLERVVRSEGGTLVQTDDQAKGWFARNYCDGAFAYYAWQVGVELTVSAVSSALLEAAIQILEDAED